MTGTNRHAGSRQEGAVCRICPQVPRPTSAQQPGPSRIPLPLLHAHKPSLPSGASATTHAYSPGHSGRAVHVPPVQRPRAGSAPALLPRPPSACRGTARRAAPRGGPQRHPPQPHARLLAPPGLPAALGCRGWQGRRLQTGRRRNGTSGLGNAGKRNHRLSESVPRVRHAGKVSQPPHVPT